MQGETKKDHYTFATSMLDLLILTIARGAAIVIGFMISFSCGGSSRKRSEDEYYFLDRHHRSNGLKKSREELEQEAVTLACTNACAEQKSQQKRTWVGLSKVSRCAVKLGCVVCNYFCRFEVVFGTL